MTIDQMVALIHSSFEDFTTRATFGSAQFGNLIEFCRHHFGKIQQMRRQVRSICFADSHLNGHRGIGVQAVDVRVAQNVSQGHLIGKWVINHTTQKLLAFARTFGVHVLPRHVPSRS